MHALSVEEFTFLRGIEAAVDRALEGHPAGEAFVYGIHQELEPRVARALEERYRAVGWSEAKLKMGETGSYTLVLIP